MSGVAVLVAGQVDGSGGISGSAASETRVVSNTSEWGRVERSWTLPEGLFRARVRLERDASIVLATAPVRLPPGERIRVRQTERAAALIWDLLSSDPGGADPVAAEPKSFAR